MKSVGEVMAVGRTFEESFQKSIRMLDIGNDGLVLNRTNGKIFSEEELENKLSHPDDQILYNVAAAIKAGFSAERINNLTKEDLGKSLLWEAKKMGFSDKQIGRAKGKTPDEIRHLRKESGVLPSVKQIDSLAAEWPAVTNYLYLTYGGNSHDVKINPDEKGIVVLGAGPYRIGSSVEFDWGTVNMVWGLQENGEKNISVVNCNPETVSTDYDICTRLYFEELTQERILDITEFEHPKGVITCVGGQTANNLTPGLAEHGVNILGTSAHDVDRAEDRSKFSAELDKLHIQQPRWQAFSNLSEAKSFAQEVGFPVIVRPSYVLSGAAMKVVWSQEELKTYVKEATDVSPDHPVVISKFMLDSLEVDVDGISNGKEVIIGAIVEHIDSAGVHSGDAMMCIPPWRLNNKTIETITEYTTKIATTFNVKGPFNLQFLVHDNHVYVIELNIRASRSMPFVSKLVKTNLISLASKAILDKPLPDIPKNKWQKIHNYGIKVPQFSFMQLEGADIALGVEMQSTGEAACFGSSFYDALAKGLTSVGYNLPQTGAALVTVGGAQNKEKLLQSIASLKNLGFKIFATEHTAEFFEEKIGEIEVVHKISEPDRKPNIADLLYDRKINFIINIPSTSTLEKYVGMLDDEYQIRRKSLELGVPVLTTIELADSFVKTLEWLKTNKTTIEPIEPYDPF
jgi:carbamoyl-phosphate synthase large subunit